MKITYSLGQASNIINMMKGNYDIGLLNGFFGKCDMSVTFRDDMERDIELEMNVDKLTIGRCGDGSCVLGIFGTDAENQAEVKLFFDNELNMVFAQHGYLRGVNHDNELKWKHARIDSVCAVEEVSDYSRDRPMRNEQVEAMMYILDNELAGEIERN